MLKIFLLTGPFPKTKMFLIGFIIVQKFGRFSEIKVFTRIAFSPGFDYLIDSGR